MHVDDTWKSLIGCDASLQHNCDKEGFNAVSSKCCKSVPRPRSVSAVTTKTLAVPVTLELGLVVEEIRIKPAHVETKLIILQIIT